MLPKDDQRRRSALLSTFCLRIGGEKNARPIRLFPIARTPDETDELGSRVGSQVGRTYAVRRMLEPPFAVLDHPTLRTYGNLWEEKERKSGFFM